MADAITDEERKLAMSIAKDAFAEMNRLRLGATDRALRKKYGRTGLASIYILRSFYLLIEEAGVGTVSPAEIDFEAVQQSHQEMCQMLRKLLTAALCEPDLKSAH